MISKQLSQSLYHLKTFVTQKLTETPIKKQFNTCIASEDNIIGQADVRSPMLSQLTFAPTRMQDIIEKTMESLPVSFNKISMIALLDSMDITTGFLLDPLSEIVSTYNDIFSSSLGKNRLSERSMERDRCFIRDHGSVLGMLSMNKRELKFCFSNYLVEHGFSQKIDGDHKGLAYIQLWLIHESKLANKNFFIQLKNISYHLNNHSVKRLTTNMAKKFLDCDSKSADVICQAYHILPDSAFSKHFR